ncbi:MAG: LEA type 2 family protein [Bacteroidota bacterium]|nr:LEA type 2 family protein [Bacteroidota bacterium]
MKNKIYFIIFFLALLNSCAMYRSVDVGDISDVDFNGLKNNKISVDISIPIENNNFYPIKIKSVDLELYLDNNYFGKISNSKKIKISANSNKTYSLPVDIEIENVFSGAMKMLQLSNSKNLNIKIKGDVKARGLIFVREMKINEEKLIEL